MQNLDKEQVELNVKIKEACSLFVNYFSKDTNSINDYMVKVYLYRDKVFDEILDDCSIFVTQMLKKITSYKTFVFIHYYTEILDGNISEKMKQIKEIIKEFYLSDNPEQDFGKAQELNEKTKQIINFVKSKLTQKKTTKEDFNNNFLNMNIPKILSDINLNSERHYYDNKDELDVISKIKDDLGGYKKFLK